MHRTRKPVVVVDETLAVNRLRTCANRLASAGGFSTMALQRFFNVYKEYPWVPSVFFIG
jgi:hypothetical protein